MNLDTLPPRCPTHTGRHAYQPGCEHCRRQHRETKRRKSRAIAYGVWQPTLVDAGPTRLHIGQLLEQGMTYRRIATQAGVDWLTVQTLHSQRVQVTRTTAERIAQVTPTPSFLVDATGVARRLQAIACAQYSPRDLLELIPAHERLIYRWRLPAQPYVQHRSFLLVADAYNQLWDTEGPRPEAAAYARSRGWQPFEAWTDSTIDDPAAAPYSAPEAVEFVDWVKLNYARLEPGHRRRVPFLDLTPAEQRELYRRHMAAGGTPRGFRDRYRPVPIDILRQLQLEWGDR